MDSINISHKIPYDKTFTPAYVVYVFNVDLSKSIAVLTWILRMLLYLIFKCKNFVFIYFGHYDEHQTRELYIDSLKNYTKDIMIFLEMRTR